MAWHCIGLHVVQIWYGYIHGGNLWSLQLKTSQKSKSLCNNMLNYLPYYLPLRHLNLQYFYIQFLGFSISSLDHLNFFFDCVTLMSFLKTFNQSHCLMQSFPLGNRNQFHTQTRYTWLKFYHYLITYFETKMTSKLDKIYLHNC